VDIMCCQEARSEGFQTWFLLANGRKRRSIDREVLQGMPVLREANPHSSPGAPDNPHYMVVRHVGPRPSEALQEGAQELDPPTRHGRQVH
jgi:hypothetical protein